MKVKVCLIISAIFLIIANFVQAQELSDREIQQIEYDAGTAYNEGVELYNSKDYHGALDKFLISLEKYRQINTEENPKTVRISELYKNLSVLYNMTKQYDKAIEYYNLRMLSEPDNYKIVTSLNKIYNTIGNQDKALQVLIDFDNNYDEYKIKYKIAQIYEGRNDIPNAIKYYSEAFALNKKKVGILEKVALMYHKIGQDTTAIKVYNDYIATKPEDYILRKVYKNLGIFYQNMGNIDDAILAFEESNTTKFDKEVCLILGQLYYERGNYTKAKLNLAKVQKVDDTEVKYEVTGSNNKVDITYANKDEGTSQANNVSMPWSYSFKGKQGQFLYISAQNQGESGSVTVTIYRGDKKFKRATSTGPFCIASANGSLIDDDYPQAHYYLGLIYRKEGKNAEALAEFEKIKNHHTLGPAAKQQIEFIKKSE